MKKRVCIVGAGVSGLIAAKYLADYPDEFEPIVFEKQSDVGGMWIYTDSTNVDEHGLPVHTSIYQSLRTNVVKDMMSFPDYPFEGYSGKGSFMSHEEVVDYMKNYTKHFNLRQYIKFDTNVENVSPLPNHRWLVVIQDLISKQKRELTFDAAIICNGHDVKGNIPEIPGIESFPGRVLHSHVYRKPDGFANQKIVVLGASYSGMDISIELNSIAKQVYLSHRHKELPYKLPSGIKQVTGVVAAEGSELILSDGTRIEADTLILCTGYFYDFPFLKEDSGIVVEDGKYIRSLYKHLVNIEHPTMAILNMVQPGLHFLLPHAQMSYFRAVLRGKLTLPSREQMLRESQLPDDLPKSKAHIVPYDIFYPFIEELSKAGGGRDKLIPSWFAPAIDGIDVILNDDPEHFRNKRLVIHEGGNVEYI